MEINPSEVTKILKEQIKKYGDKAEVTEVGQVLSVGDGIARIYGLDEVQSGEMVEFPGEVKGMVLNLEKDNVGVSIFGDDTNDKQMMTGSLDVTGSYKLNGYEVNEISNDTSMTDGSATSIPTENAVKTYLSSTGIISELAYLRKSFAHTASISNATTASFNAITASSPAGLTSTSEEDFMFFVNGMLIEGDALTIQQKTSTNLELRLNTSGLGYSLESGYEVVGFGKFNS